MTTALPNFGPWYLMRILDDDDNVTCTRMERSFLIQRCIDRFGIDHIRLMRLDGPGEYYHPSVFGFHQSRIRKNSAIAAARLRNTFRRNTKA